MPTRKEDDYGYQKTITTLREKGGGVLQVYCGYGKTALAIKIAIDLGGRTLVVVHKEFLMDQWIDSIKKFTGKKVKIGIIQQDTVEIDDNDFVIAMLHTLYKKDFPKNTFDSFNMCIIDECHHIAAEVYSRALRAGRTE